MATAKQQSGALDEEGQPGRGFGRLGFSPATERLFLAHYLAERARMVPLWALVGTILYLVAALGDLSMMPDVAPLTIALRFGLFLPYAVAVVLIMRWRPTPGTFDWLSLGVGVLGIALPMIPLIFSRSDHMFVYQTGSVATLAFFTIVLRPRLATVVAGLAIMLAIQLAATGASGRFDAVTYIGIVTFYVTLATFLALSAYFAERLDRQNFLGRLRGEALQAELARQSERDPMTDLYNRHVLLQRRDSLWAPAAGPRTVSAVMLDIDSFKRFNDVHGHVDGDACIRRIADIMQRQIGDRGTVFRYGGEEMLALLPGVDAEEVAAAAEAVRRAIEAERIAHRGLPHGSVVTASLGVATDRTDRVELEELLRRADSALYDAKRAGRNQVRVWTPAIPFPALTRVRG
jgi:diguanylate cyclase (GGDEF)-like protein